jgi:YhgE/Pip-like protein
MHRTGSVVNATKTVKFWLVPTVVVALLMSLLSALYIGGIVDPKKSLHDFPIALVNSDEGDTLPSGAPADFGGQIADGLLKGVDPSKVSLRPMGIAQAQDGMASGDLYGAIVVPSDFTKRMVILAEAGVVAGDVDKPVITVLTNPRAGTLASSLVTTIGDQALDAANTTVGQQVTKTVSDSVTAPISGAAALTLAQPIDVVVTPYNPLPDGTGLGLAAFYYALLLLLAGFTGAMVVSALVDGALGFTPTEYGPFFKHRRTVSISRLQTMFVKWVIMVAIGMLVSALYLWISTSLGMPSPHSLLLWMYGALAIAAVGITATSIVSVFGTAGLLINLILFIVLGLPSAGATIPLEATPKIFGWLAQFEPMHQVFVAVRSILYFDARADAGLTHGLAATFVGLMIGLVFGLVTVWYYDRKGLARRDSSTPVS